jgi:multiple antibiotic resistance protein
MSALLVSAVVTFFVIIDPIGNVPIFMGLTADRKPAERRDAAIRAISVAAVTLVLFGVLGNYILEYLGIGLPALRIAGGILLLLLAVDMVLARQSGLRSTTEPEDAEAHRRDDVAVFPLAIPLIAGPGAMTSVLLLLGKVGHDWLGMALILGVMLGVLFLNLVAFLSASWLMGRLGLTGVNVIGRVLGIILAALAVQYILDGLVASFPHLGQT